MDTDKIYAEAIVNEYSPKSASKTVALRKLDRKAKRPSEIFAFTFGIIMCLVFGSGMCICMGVIGPNTVPAFAMGIAIGIVGMIGMGINYPIHKKLLEKGKSKYAFEIMQLAKEICDEEG